MAPRPFISTVCLAILLALAGGKARAQSGTLNQATGEASGQESVPGSRQRTTLGVVWEAPADVRQASEDLIEMQAVGVKAARTGNVTDPMIFSLADTLGIVLYRELPGLYQSARDVRDGEAAADSLIQIMAGQSLLYASAGPIGLGWRADTTDPATCTVFARLSRLVKAISPSTRTYYVTRFLRDDVCEEAVDFVLIDVLGSDRALADVEQARQSFGGSVGIGAVGSPVERDRLAGANVPGSPEHQARTIENMLGPMLGMQLEAVFVHRWRDGTARLESLSQTGALSPDTTPEAFLAPDPYGRWYGLYDASGNPRPALQVVRGMYLGTQTVFAFSNNAESDNPTPWFRLLGWLLVVVIAAMYAGSPRFRVMIPRYFLAHGFYRNAVREAREVLPMTSTALLTITGLAIGMLGTMTVLSLRSTDAAHWIVLRMRPSLQEALTSMIDAPLALVVLVGSAGLVGISVWMAVWMTATMRRSPLLPSQALMLAVWPRFPILILVVLAMILHPGAGEAAVPVATAIAGAWLVSALWSSIRTSYDLYKVVHLSPWTAFAVWLLNPTVLLVVGVGVWAILHPGDATHLWHVIVRG